MSKVVERASASQLKAYFVTNGLSHRHQFAYRKKSYDVVSNFQDGSHRVRNILLGSCLMMAPVSENGNLSASQILMTYLIHSPD